jgi:hypothetical protein
MTSVEMTVGRASGGVAGSGVAHELGVELGFGFGAFLGRLASGHDGGSEAGGKVFGEIVRLAVTVDVDGFAGGVDDHFAVVAGPEVLFDFSEEIGVDLAIKVVG